MSAINHGTDVPINLRREVLMGYQYALHQHKKKLQAEKKTSLGKVRRAITHQADHIGTNTVRHRIPAKKDILNQSIAGEKQHGEGNKNVQEVSARHYQTKRKTSYRKHQKQP
jgi:hypothetical protein